MALCPLGLRLKSHTFQWSKNPRAACGISKNELDEEDTHISSSVERRVSEANIVTLFRASSQLSPPPNKLPCNTPPVKSAICAITDGNTPGILQSNPPIVDKTGMKSNRVLTTEHADTTARRRRSKPSLQGEMGRAAASLPACQAPVSGLQAYPRPLPMRTNLHRVGKVCLVPAFFFEEGGAGRRFALPYPRRVEVS